LALNIVFMKEKWNILSEKIDPYKGVLCFFFVMILANLFWKLVVRSDEYGIYVTAFGFDISAFASSFTRGVVVLAHSFLYDVLGMSVKMNGLSLAFENHETILIVWGCAGFKQMFIFTVIMLFSYGPWKHKLWFIPAGVVFCYFLNVFRVILLALISYNYSNMLDFFHAYVFKYAFYGIIFLVWIFWNEYFGHEKNVK